MDESISLKEKKQETLHATIDTSLEKQKQSLAGWMEKTVNQEEYLTASREKMETINKEFADSLRTKYGVTEAAPLKSAPPKQTVPAAKYWWMSRRSEQKRLKKLREKYGNQISVNSLREQKAMEDYENIRSQQVLDYNDDKLAYCKEEKMTLSRSSLTADSLTLDVKIEGYEELVKKQKLKETGKYYLRSDEINNGLTPFFAMQKRKWLFFKKTVGALGNESELERKDAAAYNKDLLKRYTKSKAGSEERMKVLDTLRQKLQTFRITPNMLTDGYLADHSTQLRRFADMTKAFRILILTNPGYLERLSEEDKIMLGNTLNYTGPLIRDFLERHQAAKHLMKQGQKTVFAGSADQDLSQQNEEVRREIWDKIQTADKAEQAAIGLKNKKVVSYLRKREEETNKKREEREKKEKLPEYAIRLQYDDSGYREGHLLEMQEKMRSQGSAYDVIGKDMDKLFDQYAKSMVTLDTLSAREYALRKTVEDMEKALEKDKKNRRYNAFLEYAKDEQKKINRDMDLMQVTVDHYELALHFVTGIKLTEEDMTIPPIEEKYRDTVQKVLESENLTFLLKLPECRFYAKEFAEISGGTFRFKEVMKESISRARGEEMKLHAERLIALEKRYGDHKLKNYQIFALSPKDLEKYNFNGYTDQEGVRHKGALDLSDEINFRHLKELASIAEMNLEEAKKALEQVCEERGDSKEERERVLLDLETKYLLCKEHYQKWEGAYLAFKAESFRFLPQVPDMEGQNGIFKDPHVFERYKEELKKKLEQKKKAEPESPDIARYEDMIALMDGFLLRSGLTSEEDEEIRLLNKDAYDAKIAQLRFDKRMNRAFKVFTYKGVNPRESKRLLKKAEDAIFFEEQYARLKNTYGDQLSNNLMRMELDTLLKKAKTEEERLNIRSSFYAKKAVSVMELRTKLNPEFFTEDYIRNNFDEFANSVLTLSNFSRLIDSAETFQLMMDGLSEEVRDDVADAVDVMIHKADEMRLLLYSVFSANNVDFETGELAFKKDIVRTMLEVLPDDELAKKFQEATKVLRDNKEKRDKNPGMRQTIKEIQEETKLVRETLELPKEAMDYESELAEDYLDKNLTTQLQKLRDYNFIDPERKSQMLLAKSPTEELYLYLYKEAGDLSFAGDQTAWKKVLKKAMENSTGTFFRTALSKEARDVAEEMLKDTGKIEDYLQWKARHDSRVYMNERSKMLGIKETQEDTNTAYEIMDAMEETRSSVHNTVNRKMRNTLFPELEKQGLDPEQFMHLLRIVHRNSAGMAERLVDVSNQSINMERTRQYLDPDNKSDFILQATTEVMKFEITENMLSEEYLKEPGNFRYMYFMAQKLKAFEQLYKNDRKSVEKALKEDTKHEALFEKVDERFGTFYGNISDQVYQMVMSFALKYGVDERGARTFGLSPEEIEQLSAENKKSTFAARSKENRKAADDRLKETISDLKKRFAAREAAFAAVKVLKDYRAFETKKWMTERVGATKDVYELTGLERIAKDGQAVAEGMEKAITLKNEKGSQKWKMAKQDNRFQEGDAAYFLPAGHYAKKLRLSKSFAERDEKIQSLAGLFSGNPILQMNFLLEDGHLKEMVALFEKHPELSVKSKKDLYSEEYLAGSFTGELFLDAKKMAVFSLLPTIIPNLFESSFLKEGGVSEETAKGSKAYKELVTDITSREQQNEIMRENAKELFRAGSITEEDMNAMEEAGVRLDREIEFSKMDRDRLIPKLKTKEQKDEVKDLLKRLKKYIGTEAQREFYKNYMNNLQKYVRVCGVNTDSPENSLGSLVSGLDQNRLDAALGLMRSEFEDSQSALKKSMNQ